MLKRGLPIRSVYTWLIGFSHFSLRQTKCKQALALMTALVLCACQSDPDAMDYSGNAHRQKECNRILAQLGVSGDNILDADVASTPERKKLVALYSAYGCDK